MRGPNMAWNTLKFSVCTLLLAAEHTPVVSIDFDRNYFGVGFTPYVTIAEENEPPDLSTYTMDNLKTLLEVLSMKFSKLKTCCVDNHFGLPYVKNSTYYDGTYIGAKTAEVAALLNRERNKKSMTVLIGLYNQNFEDDQKWQAGLRIAADAAEIANKIYPGTVEGIYIYRFDSSSMKWAELTLAGIRKLRTLTPGLGVSLGTRQYCHDLSPNQPKNSNFNDQYIWAVRKQIVLESDFIICFRSPYESDVNLGVERIFLKISREILEGIYNVRLINTKITAMGSTFWLILANDTSLASVANLRNYWVKTNDFAKKHGIRIYMDNAFDSTVHNHKNMGWWRLTKTSLISNPVGYIEKISVLPIPKPTTVKLEKTTLGPRPRTEASSSQKTELVTLRPNPPSSTLSADNKKHTKTNRFRYELLACAIGVLTVILVGGLIFFAVKRRIQVLSRNARSPVQYTGIASAPPNPVLCNLQMCLIESNQKDKRQDHEN